MNTTLLLAALLFVVVLELLVVVKSRLLAAVARLVLKEIEENIFVLGFIPGFILGFILGFLKDSTPGGMLGGMLGGAVGIELSEMLGSILVGVMLIMRVVSRHVSRTHPTNAIESPDNDCPPQFAEYLLYFLPKPMREPLLGDLEEEYHEVYARFGKRKATIWYYAQVGISYWPLLCRAARKLVKWGVLGWVGGAVRRLIS